MKKPYQKPLLTFNEQLAILEARGLAVSDREQARQQLSTISYYRLSAYCHPFRLRDSNGDLLDEFKPNTQFTDVIALYDFDRKLRLLIMDAIERVEVYIRTRVTYHLGHTYGAFGYTVPENFHPKFQHSAWRSKLEKAVNDSRDEFVAHYKKNYTGFPILPIWMVTELMTMGSLSFCYRGMKHNDKQAISNPLSIHYKRLGDWLHKLTYIRNVCSHHGRLWNRELALRPEVGSPEENWLPPITPRNDRVFYILLMLRFLLRSTPNGDGWAQNCNILMKPIAASIQWREAMGFPENWEKHPLWI